MMSSGLSFPSIFPPEFPEDVKSKSQFAGIHSEKGFLTALSQQGYAIPDILLREERRLGTNMDAGTQQIETKKATTSTEIKAVIGEIPTDGISDSPHNTPPKQGLFGGYFSGVSSGTGVGVPMIGIRSVLLNIERQRQEQLIKAKLRELGIEEDLEELNKETQNILVKDAIIEKNKREKNIHGDWRESGAASSDDESSKLLTSCSESEDDLDEKLMLESTDEESSTWGANSECGFDTNEETVDDFVDKHHAVQTQCVETDITSCLEPLALPDNISAHDNAVQDNLASSSKPFLIQTSNEETEKIDFLCASLRIQLGKHQLHEGTLVQRAGPQPSVNGHANPSGHSQISIKSSSNAILSDLLQEHHSDCKNLNRHGDEISLGTIMLSGDDAPPNLPQKGQNHDWYTSVSKPVRVTDANIFERLNCEDSEEVFGKSAFEIDPSVFENDAPGGEKISCQSRSETSKSTHSSGNVVNLVADDLVVESSEIDFEDIWQSIPEEKGILAQGDQKDVSEQQVVPGDTGDKLKKRSKKKKKRHKHSSKKLERKSGSKHPLIKKKITSEAIVKEESGSESTRLPFAELERIQQQQEQGELKKYRIHFDNHKFPQPSDYDKIESFGSQGGDDDIEAMLREFRAMQAEFDKDFQVFVLKMQLRKDKGKPRGKQRIWRSKSGDGEKGVGFKRLHDDASDNSKKGAKSRKLKQLWKTMRQINQKHQRQFLKEKSTEDETGLLDAFFRMEARPAPTGQAAPAIEPPMDRQDLVGRKEL